MNIADDLVKAFNEGYEQGKVDAVVHGHWESQIVYPWKYAKCSECHMTFDVQSNFCPDCGAKMEVRNG